MRQLTLREVQLSELEILIEFDKICKKHNLKYTLSSGTMIGAVRHKGFIPWDDDIDVNMPRPDYEKFIEIFNTEADLTRFALTRDRGKDADYPFIKILDKTVALGKGGFEEVDNLWMDIFPVDGLDKDDKKTTKIINKSIFYRHIITVSKYKGVKYYHGKHSKFKFILGKIFAKMYGDKRAIKNSLKLALKIPYESAEYVGVVTWGARLGERVPKKGFEELTELEFEGHKFKAISCWDEYLKGLYGDYMQLPPEEQRKTHSIEAYKI